MNYRTRMTVLALLTGLLTTGQSSAETLEERLRAQLRSTTQQLQTLQSEQARATAARQATEGQLAAAQAQIGQLNAQLVQASGQNTQLAAQQSALQQHAQTQVQASAEQVGKFKQAYQELLVLAKAKEAERAKLAGQLAERDTQVQSCVAHNQKMYGVAKQILDAYERVDMADVLKMRQPFASSARVKFEELAQGMGDDLYKTQFDGSMKAPAASQ
ncbi:DNA repair protein [Pseudomonas huanghezhanensis]|uniref:DNA repair protein n=1 Tax=Pseudomonas huanghezhanensis TaxID=3002903 RepID=UPI0022864FC5|nr:DNA repair protein [Pseudomonas sp. BSw22131]